MDTHLVVGEDRQAIEDHVPFRGILRLTETTQENSHSSAVTDLRAIARVAGEQTDDVDAVLILVGGQGDRFWRGRENGIVEEED